MNLGNNLFKARKKAGLSQETVAEKLGVSRQTISKWETDETVPDIYQSKKLAKLYKLSLDELIEFDVDVKEIEEIVPEKTLIFFDEIQANERALTSLKYFCENANEYHIIAAGSLLGIAINRENYSFPVGKVQMISMYPLSFKEFLVALGREQLIDEIQKHFESNERMDKDIHELCLKLYRIYLVVGGMPEVLQTYLDEQKVIATIDVQAEILASYERDMTKYADSPKYAIRISEKNFGFENNIKSVPLYAVFCI